MKVKEFDTLMKEYFRFDELSAQDPGLNGLQIGDYEKEIKKGAFAVDACLASIKKAVEFGADILFVHHGFYWGRPVPVTGINYERFKLLIENNLALYAIHLPLDCHEITGNNIGMAKALNLENLKPFGYYKRVPLGFEGTLPVPQTLDQITETLFSGWEDSAKILPFGKKEISSVGIISGDSPREIQEAIDKNLDLYITGEGSHPLYHLCREHKMNALFGGHYQTETYGVKMMKEKAEKEWGWSTCFIDIPTGL